MNTDPRLEWCKQHTAHFAEAYEAVQKAKRDEEENRAKYAHLMKQKEGASGRAA